MVDDAYTLQNVVGTQNAYWRCFAEPENGIRHAVEQARSAASYGAACFSRIWRQMSATQSTLKNVLLIVNPASRRGAGLEQQAVKAFGKAKVPVTVMQTQYAGHGA